MPCRPSAPNFGQRSIGNWLVLSISAARGAISLEEKSCTVSRNASAVSPRSKLNVRYAFGIMTGDLSGKSDFVSNYALIPPPHLVTGPCVACHGDCNRQLRQNSLALHGARGCNSDK